MPEISTDEAGLLLTHCCCMSYHVLKEWQAVVLSEAGSCQSDHNGGPTDDNPS